MHKAPRAGLTSNWHVMLAFPLAQSVPSSAAASTTHELHSLPPFDEANVSSTNIPD